VVRSAAAILVAMPMVLACSGSPSEIRSERDRAIGRLVDASVSATEADLGLIRQLRRLLPGEELPRSLLRDSGPDPRFPGLERWHGRVGDWDVDALQTTNDSQAGCVPWGTIGAVSFATTRVGAQQSYGEWRTMLTAMLKVPAEEAEPWSTHWLQDRQASRRARWYASLAVTGSEQLTIEMSCEDGFTVRRGRRTRS
jgi:hypothetical protein